MESTRVTGEELSVMATCAPWWICVERVRPPWDGSTCLEFIAFGSEIEALAAARRETDRDDANGVFKWSGGDLAGRAARGWRFKSSGGLVPLYVTRKRDDSDAVEV